MCTPLAPLVLTAPASPAPDSASRTSLAAATAFPNSPAAGGSMSSTRYEGRSRCPAGASVTWYSTARWLANQVSVGLSSHSAYRTSRCDACAHIETVLIHGGA